MSEAFDHAKELVENNKVATAGALAVAGLALYLSGGKIMSFFKPSVVEAGAELAETGAGRAGVESAASTLGRNEIPAISLGGPLNPEMELPGWVKGSFKVKTMPALVTDAPLSTTVDWDTLYSEMRLTRDASSFRPAVESWGPLLNDGDARLANAAEWARLDKELGLAGNASPRLPISDVL